MVALSGTWDILCDPPGWEAVAGALEEGGASAPDRVALDCEHLKSYDSSLVSILLNLRKRCAGLDIDFDGSSLPDGVNDLLDMALAVPETADARGSREKRSLFYRIGESSLQMLRELYSLFEFIGECLLSFGKLIRGRARFRKQDFVLTLQQSGLEALPIVSLISVLIGMILAFVGAYQMATIGATLYIANLVSIAMVREMGCLMTGIIMSGRTGAAFAAQLGSMKVNQEIDALQTFGISPIDFLVLPRMLALTLMMPLLTIYANLIGILGGGLVTCVGFDIGVEQYVAQTVEVLNLKSTFLGVGKSVLFGILIAGAGCLRGMQSGSSSAAVGNAATSAVVVSITAIIIADCVFAVLSTVLKF